MFIRFVLPFTHWRSNRDTGISHAIYQLYDEGRFAEDEVTNQHIALLGDSTFDNARAPVRDGLGGFA